MPPAMQSHTLHPPAAAFFRFACPGGGCDGEFELAPVVCSAVDAHAQRSTVSLACHGMRAAESCTSRSCSVRLECTVKLVFCGDPDA